jgi:hypothetical protein
MPVVTDSEGRATNLRTRTDDEIAAESGPFGMRKPNDGQAGKEPAAPPPWAKSFVNSAAKGFMGFNPSDQRRSNAGLHEGGVNSTSVRTPDPVEIPGVSSSTLVAPDQDWRVRITMPPKSMSFYKDPFGGGITAPLLNSGINGVVFPYTPSIQITHNARYQEQALTHSNFKNYFYEGSDVGSITISGEFTVQNEVEGEYVLACIYFLRACTKMFFGTSWTAPVGTPPPIVYLDRYGKVYLPHLTCVVNDITHTMPPDVDYIPLTGDMYLGQRMPTISTMSVTLQPVYSRCRIHQEFNLDDYARGQLTGMNDIRGIGGIL